MPCGILGILNDYKENINKDFIYAPLNKVKKAISLCKDVITKFKCNHCNKKIEQSGGNFIKHINEEHKNFIDNFEQYGGKNKQKNLDELTDDEFDEWYKNLLIRIKISFSEYENSMKWLLFEDIKEVYFEGKPIKKKKLNEVVLEETLSDKIIMLPVHRFSEYYEYLILSKDAVTYRELFTKLYEYYNKEMTLDEINKVSDDNFDYKKNAIKKYKKGEKVNRIDLMGDAIRYEGIKRITNYDRLDNLYFIYFGS